MPRPAPPERLSQMRNLGAACERDLPKVGIRTPADLLDVGAVEAYLRLREALPRINLMYLYALHAAIEDLHWRDVDEATKARLRAQAGR
jgi:DNA transformation protein